MIFPNGWHSSFKKKHCYFGKHSFFRNKHSYWMTYLFQKEAFPLDNIALSKRSITFGWHSSFKKKHFYFKTYNIVRRNMWRQKGHNLTSKDMSFDVIRQYCVIWLNLWCQKMQIVQIVVRLIVADHQNHSFLRGRGCVSLVRTRLFCARTKSEN